MERLAEHRDGDMQHGSCARCESGNQVAELFAGFVELHANGGTKRRVVSLNNEKFVSKKSKGWEWANYRLCTMLSPVEGCGWGGAVDVAWRTRYYRMWTLPLWCVPEMQSICAPKV